MLFDVKLVLNVELSVGALITHLVSTLKSPVSMMDTYLALYLFGGDPESIMFESSPSPFDLNMITLRLQAESTGIYDHL